MPTNQFPQQAVIAGQNRFARCRGPEQHAAGADMVLIKRQNHIGQGKIVRDRFVGDKVIVDNQLHRRMALKFSQCGQQRGPFCCSQCANHKQGDLRLLRRRQLA